MLQDALDGSHPSHSSYAAGAQGGEKSTDRSHQDAQAGKEAHRAWEFGHVWVRRLSAGECRKGPLSDFAQSSAHDTERAGEL